MAISKKMLESINGLKQYIHRSAQNLKQPLFTIIELYL